MTKKVATLEKVSKMYGKDELIVKALDNVNLEFIRGLFGCYGRKWFR